MAIELPESSKRYPYKVPLETGESLLGYMHRVGIRNLHSHAHTIKRHIGMSPASRVLSQMQLERLAHKTSRDARVLGTMQAPASVNNRTTFAGWPVSETDIERSHARVCPECIRDRKIHQQIWNLRLITLCPIHGAKLVDACPKCGDPLLWSRMDLWKCARNHSLAQVVADRERVAQADRAGVGAIYEKCGLSLAGSQYLQQLPPAIRDLDLSGFMAFLLFVGRAVSSHKTAGRSRAGYRYNRDQTHEILSAGFEMSKNWPEGFIHRLGQLDSSRREGHQIGLGPRLGPLLQLHSNRESEPFFELLREAIKAYVARHSIFLRDHTKRILEYEGRETNDISCLEARDILNCSTETARKLAIKHNWCSGAPGTGNKLRIDRAKFDHWRQNEAPITVAEAARVLGLWRQGAFELNECGMLPCVFGEQTCGHEPGQHLVRKVVVDGLLKIIERPIDAPDRNTEFKVVSWRHFQHRQNAKGLHASFALQAMLAGRLKARSRKEGISGFDGLLFSLVDLVELSAIGGQKRLKNSRDDRRRSISIADAAKLEGIGRQNIFRAIYLRLLDASNANDKRGTRLIKLSELRRFVDLYTTVPRLARENRVHNNTVKHALRRLRVTPIGRREGPYSGFPIYSKRELERANVAKELTARRRALSKLRRASP